jgi:hypothetical protein
MAVMAITQGAHVGCGTTRDFFSSKLPYQNTKMDLKMTASIAR